MIDLLMREDFIRQPDAPSMLANAVGEAVALVTKSREHSIFQRGPRHVAPTVALISLRPPPRLPLPTPPVLFSGRSGRTYAALVAKCFRGNIDATSRHLLCFALGGRGP